MPGTETRSKCLAAAMTSVFALGEITIWPPASATAATSLSVSTVPAPIRAWRPQVFRSWAIETSGSGEFNGTSINEKPTDIKAAPTSAASPG